MFIKSIKKLITFIILLSSGINLSAANNVLVQNQIAQEDKENQSFIERTKQKIKNVIQWCKQNPGKTALIGAGIAVTIVGATFVVYKYKTSKKKLAKQNDDTQKKDENSDDKKPQVDDEKSKEEKPVIKFNPDFIDRSHSNDGKLPNGEEGPKVKEFKYGECKVAVSQLPGLKQTRCDCGYYTMYGIKCFAENNEEALKDRQHYQQCEIEWKNELVDEKYAKKSSEGISDRNEEFSFISDSAFKVLINRTTALKNVKAEYYNFSNGFPLLSESIFKSKYTSGCIKDYFELNSIAQKKQYLMVIKDNDRNHWYAARIVFHDNKHVDLSVVDSLGDATETSKVKEISEALAKVAAKIKG